MDMGAFDKHGYLRLFFSQEEEGKRHTELTCVAMPTTGTATGESVTQISTCPSVRAGLIIAMALPYKYTK